VDIEKNGELLGWAPPVSFDDGLQRVVLANSLRND
jgi:nucleoside-diphosphate-sugar epimerase